MGKLGDKFRELQSICEGEILKKEATLVALRHEVERLRKELADAKRQQLTTTPKCSACAYRVIALRTLEEKEKAKK